MGKSNSTAKNSKLVYSTDRDIARKEHPAEALTTQNLPPSEQRVIVKLERKGRGGKSMTIIDGLQMPLHEMRALLKDLKEKLGTGGSLKENSFEIQGDRCDAVMSILEKMGYKPKRSGK